GGPAIGPRVIDRVRAGVAAPVIAAYRMELPVERRDSQRPARREHGLAGRPPIGDRVVLVQAGHRRPDGEQRELEPADDVEAVIHHPDPRMVQTAGQRGALAPGVGGRIVFLDGWSDEREALLKASDHVHLATDGGDRHFGPVEQSRRLGDPSALGLGPYGSGDRRESRGKAKSSKGNATHGAIVIATRRGWLCVVTPRGRGAPRSAGAADRTAPGSD